MASSDDQLNWSAQPWDERGAFSVAHLNPLAQDCYWNGGGSKC